MIEEPHFKRVAVIGLGLIGGSIAKAARIRGLVGSVVAYDRDETSLALGKELNVVDGIAGSVAEAAHDADLVVLAVPLLSMASIFSELAPLLGSENTIITDVGSVKCSVFEAARTVAGNYPVNLVPGHPIAGSEVHGVRAAEADLFANHKVILTPKLSTNGDATHRVRKFWQALDAEVVEMDPEHHDTILAQTSHLPHLLAYALVDTLSSQGDSLEIFQYAAGGFRDFTRIAASDPTMWRDIFASNPGPVLEILDRYIEDLVKLRGTIEAGRYEELVAVFMRSKAARDHFSQLLAQRTVR